MRGQFSGGRFIPPLIGILVAIYWSLAFWAALTAPLYEDRVEWDPMELLRRPGFVVGTPIYEHVVDPFASTFGEAMAIFCSVGIGFGAVCWLVAHFLRMGLIRRSRSRQWR